MTNIDIFAYKPFLPLHILDFSYFSYKNCNPPPPPKKAKPPLPTTPLPEKKPIPSSQQSPSKN